jgi:toxin HigB-1
VALNGNGLTADPLSGTLTQWAGGGMIVSFRDAWLRAFFVEDVRSRNIPPDLEARLFRKLQMTDDAATDRDVRTPRSNHFEKLHGNLVGFCSIRVNGILFNPR